MTLFGGCEKYLSNSAIISENMRPPGIPDHSRLRLQNPGTPAQTNSAPELVRHVHCTHVHVHVPVHVRTHHAPPLGIPDFDFKTQETNSAPELARHVYPHTRTVHVRTHWTIGVASDDSHAMRWWRTPSALQMTQICSERHTTCCC